MTKIIAFSKYLTYMLGGAEKSTLEILKQKSNNKIELVSFDNLKSLGAHNKKVSFPRFWKISYINDVFHFRRFFYWEYVLNRSKVKNYFRAIDDSSILYTYAIYAPIAIISYSGDSILFIRSESDLGIRKNYHEGLMWFVKYIYMFLEYPAFFVYRHDLKKAVKISNVICNSKYMSRMLKTYFNKNSEVLYPFIDEDRIKNAYEFIEYKSNKYIVFVGDAIIKGLNIAKKIAKAMPNNRFMFFSRFVNETFYYENITWMPWQSCEVDIYKYARVVIVPSICAEAYGRVSREAYILDIPVLVSNVGGLPESVNEDRKYIVTDYLNINEWKNRIEGFL